MQFTDCSGCMFRTFVFGMAIALASETAVRGERVAASITATVQTGTPRSVQVNPLPKGAVPETDSEAAANELSIIEVCRSYVEAQLNYFRTRRNAEAML